MKSPTTVTAAALSTNEATCRTWPARSLNSLAGQCLLIVIVVGFVLAGCSSDDSATTTVEPQQTTTGSTEPRASEFVSWSPEVEAQLIALQGADDGQWTVESAMAAIEILRPVFIAGVDESPPIDLSGLIGFIGDNYADFPEDRLNLILADAPSRAIRAAARPQAAAESEEARLAFQSAAEQVNLEFENLSGHRMGTPIYVAISDLYVPLDVYAATWLSEGNLDAFRILFAVSSDAFDTMEEDVEAALATSPQVCIVVLGKALTEWSVDRQRAGLMHEIVHCHQNVIHPGGPRAFYTTDVDWMDEGYAAWVGEAFAGGTLTSQRWWNEYFTGGVGAPPDGFQLFEGTYKAIDFYNMLATGGKDPYTAFGHWFGTLRGNSVSNVARYRDMVSGLDPSLVAGWTATTSRNGGFGEPWNSPTGPGSGSSTATRSPQGARASTEGRVLRARTAEQRYWAIEFATSVDKPSLITISADGLGTLRWVADGWDEQFIVTETLDRTWCVGEDCVCEDGTSPAPDALQAPISAGDRPVLHAALFGGDGASVVIATAHTIEEACEEEVKPVVIGPLDACLVGTWNPDPQQLLDYLLTLYRAVGVSDLMVEGTIDLVFRDDGSFAQNYNGVRGSGSAFGETIEAEWAGGSFGTWEATGGVLTLNFTGSDISAKVNEVSTQAPSNPPGTVEASYTCGTASLEVQPPPRTPGQFWPLPTHWEPAAP